MLRIAAVVLCLLVARPALADDDLVLRPPNASRVPDWTYAVLGTGIGMVAAGLGTGVGALLVQLDLDQVCTTSCPTSAAGQQNTGRILAITTDVLWLGGIVVGVFGLITALTLREDVPSVAAACDATGCMGLVGHRF